MRTVAAAIIALSLAGCELVNAPRDPWAMPVEQSVYVYDELQPPSNPATQPSTAPEPEDDGTAFKSLRNWLGLP